MSYINECTCLNAREQKSTKFMHVLVLFVDLTNLLIETVSKLDEIGFLQCFYNYFLY